MNRDATSGFKSYDAFCKHCNKTVTWEPYTNGVLNISGGTISGGNAAVGANIMVAVGGSVNMSGGKVDGDFYMVSGTKATLSGVPVISGTGIQVPAGGTISVAGLRSGASIVVDADGIFTEELTDPSAYLPYFTAARQVDKIQVEGNALSYIKQRENYNGVNNGNLAFTSGSNATCPVCKKGVTWTKLTADAITLEGNRHYYLDSDISYTGTEAAYITGPGAGLSACVHLNGHNITATAQRVIEAKSGTLNVMGNGTVSGGYNENRLFGATVNHSGINGVLNLIGGTYTKADTCTVSPVVLLRGGDVNMYKGATVYSTVNNNSCANVQVYTNCFNLFGGKIYGGSGIQLAASNWSPTVSGKANVHGGEIVGSVVISGGENATVPSSWTAVS